MHPRPFLQTRVVQGRKLMESGQLTLHVSQKKSLRGAPKLVL